MASKQGFVYNYRSKISEMLNAYEDLLGLQSEMNALNYDATALSAVFEASPNNDISVEEFLEAVNTFNGIASGIIYSSANAVLYRLKY